MSLAEKKNIYLLFLKSSNCVCKIYYLVYFLIEFQILSGVTLFFKENISFIFIYEYILNNSLGKY